MDSGHSEFIVSWPGSFCLFYYLPVLFVNRTLILLPIDQFNNKPVNIFFTDTHFKHIKSIPFDAEMAKKLQEPEIPAAVEEITTPADSTGTSNQ